MYRRAPLSEACPCHPEKTGARFQARFVRLAADQDFRAVVSFHEQVLFANGFLEAEDDQEEREFRRL